MRRALPNFQHLFKQLEDTINTSVLSRMPTSILSPTSSLEGPEWVMNAPTTDVHETSKSYIIEAELPGLAKENISIELQNEHTIDVSGKYTSEQETKGKRYWSKERLTGDFKRAFTFPQKIDPDKIHAAMKNGILQIEIEKAQEETVKKLPIKID